MDIIGNLSPSMIDGMNEQQAKEVLKSAWSERALIETQKQREREEAESKGEAVNKFFQRKAKHEGWGNKPIQGLNK